MKRKYNIDGNFGEIKPKKSKICQKFKKMKKFWVGISGLGEIGMFFSIWYSLLLLSIEFFAPELKQGKDLSNEIFE